MPSSSKFIALNNLRQALRLNSGPLSGIRGARPPSRNGLSHAGKQRKAVLAEKLFWSVLDHLHALSPGFGRGKLGKGVTHRFRKTIHLVDSTTIELVALCMDWAKHRRRKAAAKRHMRLNLQSFLPNFVLIDTAKDADPKRAREAAAGVEAGQIVIFDRAYVDFLHLLDLFLRGVFRVTRTKENHKFKLLKHRKNKNPKILADEEVILSIKSSRQKYPQHMRRVRALVEVDGQGREMEFLTNNMDWRPQSVADLYRSCWTIEVFFKQIKQTLKLADFLGHSSNAVRWQIWTALLCYLLLRYQAFLSSWESSFTRLFTLIHAALWQKNRPTRSFAILWDRRRQLPGAGQTGTDLLSQISPEISWDSTARTFHGSQEGHSQILKPPLKIDTHIPAWNQDYPSPSLVFCALTGRQWSFFEDSFFPKRG
jgi:hypothetical protein